MLARTEFSVAAAMGFISILGVAVGDAGPAARRAVARHRSETQKPLAIVVIGGALALTILPRLIQAPLLILCARFRHPRPEAL